MRLAKPKAERSGCESSDQVDRVFRGTVNTPRVRGVDDAAPGAISRILASAVLEQLERDRNDICVAASLTPVAAVNTKAFTDSDLKDIKVAEPAAASSAAATQRMPLWKRMFDCATIVLAAPFWLPLTLLIMLGIKLSSPGPIFYKQERVGFRGRRFMIFKFRTMKVNVETTVHESYFAQLMQADVPMTKLDANGDPRLICYGRLLRAAGLDELPQLFNVLRGDMSLVGPRPCTVHEFERYLPYQRERVKAPPGLTGYWQVHGKNRTTFSEMIEMDIFYADKMCLALDLWILCKTIPAVFAEVIEARGFSFSPRRIASVGLQNPARSSGS